MKFFLKLKGELKFLSEDELKQVVMEELKLLERIGKVEVSIRVVEDKEMIGLNGKYMGKKGPTDVLSFPLEKEKGPDGIVRLGDIVINMDEVKRRSKGGIKKARQELEFLVSHGVKHLLGIHHD